MVKKNWACYVVRSEKYVIMLIFLCKLCLVLVHIPWKKNYSEIFFTWQEIHREN